VLGVLLVERADKLAVWLGQLWLRLADSAHSSVVCYVPVPSVFGNPLGHRVETQWAAELVLEKVEVVSQLSMELLACRVH
jgi:hypothetical protein